MLGHIYCKTLLSVIILRNVPFWSIGFPFLKWNAFRWKRKFKKVGRYICYAMIKHINQTTDCFIDGTVTFGPVRSDAVGGGRSVRRKLTYEEDRHYAAAAILIFFIQLIPMPRNKAPVVTHLPCPCGKLTRTAARCVNTHTHWLLNFPPNVSSFLIFLIREASIVYIYSCTLPLPPLDYLEDISSMTIMRPNEHLMIGTESGFILKEKNPVELSWPSRLWAHRTCVQV